jgi:hypothetical protein
MKFVLCMLISIAIARASAATPTANGKVLATRHAANEVGACSLPDGAYTVTNPVALGDIAELGGLKFRADLCGKVLTVNCGHGDLDIVVTNSNLGGGLDLYASTWAKATKNLPPGRTSCSVKLSTKNAQATRLDCYHATGEVSNEWYRNVGLLNTNGRIVKRAVLNRKEGQHRGANPYFAFDGQAKSTDKVTFHFEDGTSHSVALSACKNGEKKRLWA